MTKRCVFSHATLGLVALTLLGTLAVPARAAHRKPLAPEGPPARQETGSQGNPLLPPPLAVEALWPDLAMAAKAPGAVPDGLTPTFTADDWAAYRQQFGSAADDVLRKRASQVAEFAQELIGAAAKTEQPGLRRLLLIRATVLTYRATSGNPTAQKALAAYREAIDLNAPAQVAALFTLSDGLARQIATPKAQRPQFSALAAQANIQLCMLLLESNQVAAAQSVVKLLGRHEGALRADKALHEMALQVRALVSQTAAMFETLHTAYDQLARGDDSGALPLYIYGRLVKLNPAAAHALATHRNNAAARELDARFAQVPQDPGANYPLAESLKKLAPTLPEGILRQRTLFAALQAYRAFLAAPQTQGQRVERTLSRMAMQAAAGDGAAPNPVIRPFEKPPATTAPAGPAGPTTQAEG